MIDCNFAFLCPFANCVTIRTRPTHAFEERYGAGNTYIDYAYWPRCVSNNPAVGGSPGDPTMTAFREPSAHHESTTHVWP